ncbi:MAG: hypothetical protein MUF52_12995 [Syntrophobacteraceae bacterium]|nr:hypothetical protein [Syntrophobacteraceae bacterium]
MSEIINFEAKKTQMAARRGFKNWPSRFSESFDEHTRFSDVSDRTLRTLIKGGEESTQPVYDLVMGFFGMGSGFRFHDLEAGDKMEVMDVVIFLLDQFRFEAMRRLGWLEDDPTLGLPIVEAIGQYASRFAVDPHRTPRLSAGHPRFDEYTQAFENDRYAFVRRLIPEAIEIYDKKAAEDPSR